MLKRLSLLAAAAAALLLGAARSFAAGQATLNVDVTIAGDLSVSVDASASSTHTAVWNAGTPNARLVSAATAAVTNDSGGLTEKWALSTNPNSINTAGGADSWALTTSTASLPGPDRFAVQAVFGSSNTAAGGCPLAAAADWDGAYAVPLTASPVAYTSTVFADPNLSSDGDHRPDVADGAADGRMFAGSKRALCWRVITPNSTSTTQTQNIQIVITAQAP